MRIGVMCSGGDAPGMNACIRAVVRAAGSGGHEVLGIRRGFQGLIEEDFFLDVYAPPSAEGETPLMTLRSVSGISKVGGAILMSSRSQEFRTEEGQKKGAANLVKHRVGGLIVIGGDGSFHGAVALSRHWGGRIVGCPGTIDNDLIGSDFTIGFSTAVQTATEAVDKLRDTAQSHERMFLIEVMGRHSGYIGVYTALAAGAETVCVPETETNIPQIVAHLKDLKARGKHSVMMVVSEGDEMGDAATIQKKLEEAGAPFQVRTVVLGHLQRGGSPTAEDRILASQCGDFAVKSILSGVSGVMAGVIGGKCVLTPFEETYAEHRAIPPALLQLLKTLSA